MTKHYLSCSSCLFKLWSKIRSSEIFLHCQMKISDTKTHFVTSPCEYMIPVSRKPISCLTGCRYSTKTVMELYICGTVRYEPFWRNLYSIRMMLIHHKEKTVRKENGNWNIRHKRLFTCIYVRANKRIQLHAVFNINMIYNYDIEISWYTFYEIFCTKWDNSVILKLKSLNSYLASTAEKTIKQDFFFVKKTAKSYKTAIINIYIQLNKNHFRVLPWKFWRNAVFIT